MTLLSDFLKVLGVPHTESYSDSAFRGMTFKSLFGFSRLLGSYGVRSEALRLSDKADLARLPCPFIVQDDKGFAIVTRIDGKEGRLSVSLIRDGKEENVAFDVFTESCTGVVLLVSADRSSREPDYTRHHFHDLVEKGKFWILAICALFLGVSGFILSGLWTHVSTVLLTMVNGAGIFVTWLLLLKTLKVKSRSADRICGVLQEHGCDHVLEQKASTFFGIFSWSEVGITYFSLSTLIMFVFPDQLHYLAFINGCCLPFTLWSIWYQKFRLRTWCTLCVITQCLLWLQFFCYLAGGWWQDIFPLRLPLFMMATAYVTVLLSVNRVMTFIKNIL